MHDQTFGFEAFFKGDDIELVDSRSLLVVGKCKVKEAKISNTKRNGTHSVKSTLFGGNATERPGC